MRVAPVPADRARSSRSWWRRSATSRRSSCPASSSASRASTARSRRSRSAGGRVLLYPLYHPAAALYTPKMLEVLRGGLRADPGADRPLRSSSTAAPAPPAVDPALAAPAASRPSSSASSRRCRRASSPARPSPQSGCLGQCQDPAEASVRMTADFGPLAASQRPAGDCPGTSRMLAARGGSVRYAGSTRPRPRRSQAVSPRSSRPATSSTSPASSAPARRRSSAAPAARSASSGPVTSPTYTIGHRYDGRVVSHLDLYRFAGADGRGLGRRSSRTSTDAIVLRRVAGARRRRCRRRGSASRLGHVDEEHRSIELESGSRSARRATLRRMRRGLVLAFDTATPSRRARSCGTARCSASASRARSRARGRRRAAARGRPRAGRPRRARRRHRPGQLHGHPHRARRRARARARARHPGRRRLDARRARRGRAAGRCR